MTLSRGHHFVYDTHYHIVFPVKYRKALLEPDVASYIKEISHQIAERYDFDLEQIGTDGDHIHLLCSFAPKYSGGQFVRLYKSITANELFKQFPKLKKGLWGGEFWSDGYYFATVSERGNWKVVEQYVKNQGTPKGNTIDRQLTLW
jgi:putative transposase